MYTVDNAAKRFEDHRTSGRTGRRFVNSTVLALGVTSLFTDISSEMITAVLPLYLVFGLNASPLAFGVVDGLYTGATAVVRLLAGWVADRLRRHKEVAVAGYAFSTLTRVALIPIGSSVAGLAGLLALDRIGKGIRTAPRDAMISLATPRESWGTAFGVHRSLDMTGALLGPVLTFAVLAVAPGAFDAVFVASFCAGLIGLAVIVVYLPKPARPPVADPDRPVTLVSALRLVREPRLTALLVAATLLGLATISDAFVYLSLQDRLDFDIALFPLLYVVTALVFVVMAVPVGRLADRVGRGRVFTGGYVALALLYVVLLSTGGTAAAVLVLVLLGTSYAATDGVLAALAAESLPEELRGSGMALVATLTSLARMVSSVLFGLLWTAYELRTAITAFTVALPVVLVVAVLLVGRRGAEVRDDDLVE